MLKILKWTDEDMLIFAKINTEGSYGDYRGCKTLISKLNKYKELCQKKESRTE